LIDPREPSQGRSEGGTSTTVQRSLEEGYLEPRRSAQAHLFHRDGWIGQLVNPIDPIGENRTTLPILTGGHGRTRERAIHRREWRTTCPYYCLVRKRGRGGGNGFLSNSSEFSVRPMNEFLQTLALRIRPERSMGSIVL
jgi:hypothetical protein